MAILLSIFVLFCYIYFQSAFVTLCTYMYMQCQVLWETVLFSHLRKNQVSMGNKNNCFTKGPDIKCFVVLLKGFHFNSHKEYLRNGKRAVCNHGVMDARGRLLSTKEA